MNPLLSHLQPYPFERLRQLSRTGRQLQRAAGILLAVVGVLMITGRLEAISYWLLETFPVLGRIG